MLKFKNLKIFIDFILYVFGINFCKYFMSNKIKFLFFISCVIYSANVLANINVAVVAPMQGEYATLGRELINGARIAVDEINKEGGIKGEKISLVEVDDQCDDVLATSTAQMMSVSSRKDKMDLVVGPFCQNALNKVAQLYSQAKILQILPMPVSSYELADKPNSLFLLTGNSDQLSLSFFTYYLQHFDFQKMALVYNGADKDVIGMAEALQEEFFKAGKHLDFKSFNFIRYNKDYDKLAQDVMEYKAKVVMILGHKKDVAKTLKELRKKDKNLPIFVNQYQVQNYLFDEYEKYVNNTYFLSLPNFVNNPDFTETLVRLRLHGINPKGLTVYSYISIQLWADMVKRANSYAFNSLVNKNKQFQLNMPWGNISYLNGYPQTSVNYSIYLYKDKEYTQVY